jgi:origin recognition complex subunit 5
LTIAEQAAKAEKKTKGDNIKDDIWDEEVEHLTMSVKLWSLVRFSLSPCPVLRFPLSHTPFEDERLSSQEVADRQIPELEGKGLLKRVSPVDRLDNIMLRCEVDYETVKTLAKELKVILDDYIYEAVQ